MSTKPPLDSGEPKASSEVLPELQLAEITRVLVQHDVIFDKGSSPKEKGQNMDNQYPPNFQDILGSAALLGLFGRGYGGFGGYGPQAGAGYGWPSIADEVAVHSLKTPTVDAVCEQFRDLERQVQSSTERTADGVARLVDINRDLQMQAAAAQCDLRAELAKCCCETQKEIIQSRHITELGFKDMTKQLCDLERSLSDKITEGALAEANRRAATAEAALSNAQQTSTLLGAIAQCCNNGHGKSGS